MTTQHSSPVNDPKLRQALTFLASKHARDWGTSDPGAASMLFDFGLAVLRLTIPAQRLPDKLDLIRIIARNIDCEKECQHAPESCGCAVDAADAILSALSSTERPSLTIGAGIPVTGESRTDPPSVTRPECCEHGVKVGNTCVGCLGAAVTSHDTAPIENTGE